MPKRMGDLKDVHKKVNFNSPRRPSAPKKAETAGFKQDQLVKIPINLIEVDKNLRDVYSDKDLDDLGESMLENGQLQPCIVHRRGKKYVINYGHRRYKACVLKNIPYLLCVIQDDFKDDVDRIITQAIENEQRLNFSPRERETYLSQLLDLGLTQNEIARKLHKNKGWVSEALKVHDFVEENKEAFASLSEEPSTRDAWKASQLSRSELDAAIKSAKAAGGTKDAFKREVGARYAAKPSANLPEGAARIVVLCEVTVNSKNNSATVGAAKSDDKALAAFVTKQVKQWYKDKGYSAK